MTLREMVAYTQYYRDIAFYWRFVRFDVHCKGDIQVALHLRRHRINTVRFGTN